MNNRFAFWIVLTSLIASSALAGPRDFIKKTYNSEQNFDGLFIYSVIQDHNGFVWIGSEKGLYRYDGKEMLNLNSQDSTMGRLVTSTAIGKDGHMYLGYFEGGISVVEYGKYRKIITQDSVSGRINSIRAHKDDVWALTQSNGFIKISNGKATHFQVPILEESLSKDFVIVGDIIYVATDQGLMKFNLANDKISVAGFIEETMDIPLNALHQDQDRIWIGSEDGLMFYDLKKGNIGWLEGFEESYRISSISQDELGTLWVGSFESGLFELEMNEGELSRITRFKKSNGFESDQIQEVYVDSENEIWVGTFGRGLVQLNRAYFHHYELYQSAGIENVNTLKNMSEDQMILGTDNGLIRTYRPVLKDSLVFEKLNFTSGYAFESLLVDGNIIWGGTKESGVVKIDLVRKTIRRVFLNPIDIVEHHLIRDIKEDLDGNLWISAGGNGVYHMTKEGDLIDHYNTRSGFYHNEITSILPDDRGNVWFGSPATGLALLTDGEMRFLSKDKVFPSFSVNTLSQDANGNIWITTDQTGIFKYDFSEFTQYTEENGLLSNFCNAVITDRNGNAWIGHRLGLSMIQSSDEAIRIFNHPSELGETEAVLNSVSRDDDGNIFFGNPYGITKVNLPHFNFRTVERETHVKDIRLFFEDIELDNYSEVSERSDMLPTEIKFPFDKNHLTFDFVSINLRNPESIFYKYKLEGFDKNWSPHDKVNFATYNNLEPGKYSFLVKASDHSDKWAEDYTRIDFRVSSPYWETWWFYSLQIGLIIGILFFTYFLSARIKNQFVIRLMVYIGIFIAFEYIHTELEPWVESITGETPIFQVGMNLILALILLPVEIYIIKYMKKHAAERVKS